MSTVITVRSAGGAPARRCDAKCHGATKPTCVCICGGVNHGLGYAAALRTVRARFRAGFGWDPRGERLRPSGEWAEFPSAVAQVELSL